MHVLIHLSLLVWLDLAHYVALTVPIHSLSLVDLWRHISRVWKIYRVLVDQRLREHLIWVCRIVFITLVHDLWWVDAIMMGSDVSFCCMTWLVVKFRLWTSISSWHGNLSELWLCTAESALWITDLVLQSLWSGLFDNKLLLQSLNLVDLALNTIKQILFLLVQDLQLLLKINVSLTDLLYLLRALL